jgi:hypothetical protein
MRSLALAAALTLGTAAAAEERAAVDVYGELRAALEAHADLPKTPTALPAAAARRRQRMSDQAFGATGDENRSERGSAASADKSANADGHNAAQQARTNGARGSGDNGNHGNGNNGNGHGNGNGGSGNGGNPPPHPRPSR